MNFIYQEHRFSILSKMLSVLALFGILPALCLAVPSGHPLIGLVLAAAATTPIVLLRRSAKKFAGAAQDQFDEFVKKVGPVDVSAYSCGSGIAVQLKEQLLSLKEDEKQRTYPFSQVRSWRSTLATPGRVEARTVAELGAAAAKNSGMMTRARMDTGIFISVKDIDNPVWHVRLRDQATLNRWHEILNQALGESEKTLHA